jgi:hypothetical protein
VHREQYKSEICQYIDETNSSPKGGLNEASAIVSKVADLLHTKSKHLPSLARNCHGSTAPHWNAETTPDRMLQEAMNTVSSKPMFRCCFEAVKILSNEMMDSFAKHRVAI